MLQPAPSVERPKKYDRLWSGRSSGQRVQARKQCLQSPHRAGTDRADRVAGRKAWAARRAAPASVAFFAPDSSPAAAFHALGVAVACDKMVIDHADRLHERVHDRWADEFEPVGNKLFRHFL